METRRSPMGLSRVPLGHWVIAVIFAVGVAWGIHAWLGQRASQSAQTATLSWDAAVARQADPNLAGAAEPVVAMAQSILSDSVVASLAQSASLPSSGSTARIGEFRSRLELRQSSPSLLQVQFHDASAQRAVRTANAVARTLIAGPLASASAPAAAVPNPVLNPLNAPSAAAKAPVTAPVSRSNNALAQSLGQLRAELSSTQQKLDGFGSANSERREYAGEPSSYRESNEQQLLTAEVGAALHEVADLRKDPENAGEAQGALRRIQEALFSVWPASRAGRGLSGDFVGFNAAGVDASRLRQERAQFAHVLEVVQREQEAVRHANPVEAAIPSAPAPSSSESQAAMPASSPSSSGVTPAIAESDIPKPSVEQPFRLLRPAGSPERSPLWPAVLAGLCCGTLYLAVAGSRYRQDEEEEEAYDASEGEADAQRLITPAKPLRPAEFFAGADARPGEIISPPQRIETADPPVDLPEEKNSNVIDQKISMAADPVKRSLREGIVAEEGDADPWIDNMMKTLSETSIGKMFEKPAAQDRQEGSAADANGRRLPVHPDRLAG
ncbi:MAG: hypothetical protein WBW84_17560 [Acidobacteriaceae bacterium]